MTLLVLAVQSGEVTSDYVLLPVLTLIVAGIVVAAQSLQAVTPARRRRRRRRRHDRPVGPEEW